MFVLSWGDCFVGLWMFNFIFGVDSVGLFLVFGLCLLWLVAVGLSVVRVGVLVLFLGVVWI